MLRPGVRLFNSSRRTKLKFLRGYEITHPRAWKQFDIGWVEVFPHRAPVAVGTVVAVLIRHLGFWSLNGCRVLYTVGSRADARFGFAYGTLTNHAEAGEELFEVFVDPETDVVM